VQSPLAPPLAASLALRKHYYITVLVVTNRNWSVRKKAILVSLAYIAYWSFYSDLRGALYEMGSKIRFFFIALIDRYII